LAAQAEEAAMIRSCATSELLNIHPELDRLFDEFTSGRFLSGSGMAAAMPWLRLA